MSGRARVAALGGGTGLASLLRGLKRRAVDPTAIVTVTDDGGSSGRLRRELGMLPPGDVRNCLVALADDESLMGRLFQHRFAEGDLSGHSFGNLFLAALTQVTDNFATAIEECSHVLKIGGQVLPSTLTDVRLWGEKEAGEHLVGETRIAGTAGACRRVWLEPEPTGYEKAVTAIECADLVVLGPGSLFTSVLPHLAVPELAEVIARAPGVRAYVCNVMTQPGETDGFDAVDHVDAILAAAPGAIDVVVVHDGPVDAATAARYAAQNQVPVVANRDALEARGLRVIGGDVAEAGALVRHNPDALSGVLVELLESSRVEPAR